MLMHLPSVWSESQLSYIHCYITLICVDDCRLRPHCRFCLAFTGKPGLWPLLSEKERGKVSVWIVYIICQEIHSVK